MEESVVRLKHEGIVLEPSGSDFDVGGSTYGCAFVDEEDPETIYLYYSGARDTRWTHASIGLSTSRNGRHFTKLTKINPLIDGKNGQFNSKHSITPAVARIDSHYYMFFAGRSSTLKMLPSGSRIGVAYADDPLGPWEVLGVLKKAKSYWEGWSIDLGPSVVKTGEREVLVYYSSLGDRNPFRIISGARYSNRSMGILKVRIRSPESIETFEYEGNPLRQLNGPRGTPNESLFCPGCLQVDHRYYLFPGMSTYSVGFPYRQYVGLATDDNPFFQHTRNVSVLIHGPNEKKDILGEAKGEIALDTPCPLVREGNVYLYYSAMNRREKIWKIAMSITDSDCLAKI